jgi:zinc protease
MKRIYPFLLLCSAVLLANCVFAFAQDVQKLPLDPKLRYGKLPNGMTYYIRHKECISFKTLK